MARLEPNPFLKAILCWGDFPPDQGQTPENQDTNCDNEYRSRVYTGRVRPNQGEMWRRSISYVRLISRNCPGLSRFDLL